MKFRGFRIEPGEIEDLLRQFPAVKDAVVVLDNDSKMPRLIGYVVTCSLALEPRDLRAHLKARLPEYMVPATFVVLPQWPSLPAERWIGGHAPGADAVSRRSSEPPHRNGAECGARLGTVLEIHPIGTDDNFFDLGGHSLQPFRSPRVSVIVSGSNFLSAEFLNILRLLSSPRTLICCTGPTNRAVALKRMPIRSDY